MVRGRHPLHSPIIKELFSSNESVATHRFPPQSRGRALTSGRAPSSQLRRGAGKIHKSLTKMQLDVFHFQSV